ncbi:DUF7096 domain-containing protein [Halosolutus halophilus]|uniref:DUF7096 domain-containing protein n=1 Tax=Halosolutus halophilus TaxID=1552990 RepID=UPI002234F878|nr:hypothetical protein [Halosolutus halophilus]
MNSATPALLALLLVCSLVAIPVAAGPGDGAQFQAALQERTTNDAAADETTSRLPLEGETRREYAVFGADLGTLLVTNDDELRTDHAQYVILDREFEEASVDERKAMIERAHERIRERADELEARERRAVIAHAEGDTSTTELLQVVLRNHREAEILSNALLDIEDRADRIPGYSVSTQDDRDELEMHRTPMRERLESAARGQTDDALVVVETTATGPGYTLSYLESDYVRETTRFDNRNGPEWVSEFEDISDAYEHAIQRYPWVFDDKNRGSAEAGSIEAANLYQIQANHDQGQLTAYFGGHTASVYREVQVLNPSSLPTATETTWSENGLEVTVNETPASGPVEVTVRDAETNESVPASVTVDGFAIGETGSDGSIWFAPPAEEYNLTVETESSSIEVEVSDAP